MKRLSCVGLSIEHTGLDERQTAGMPCRLQKHAEELHDADFSALLDEAHVEGPLGLVPLTINQATWSNVCWEAEASICNFQVIHDQFVLLTASASNSTVLIL